MPPEKNKKINNGIVGSIQETNKEISSSNKTTEKVNDSIADLVEDVKDAIEDAKDLASENISSKKISNDLSDLLRDLEQDLKNTSNSAESLDKEFDKLIKQCNTAVPLFKNSDEITDKQLECLDSIITTCTNVVDDTSLEREICDVFEKLSTVLNKAKNILSKQKKSYPSVTRTLKLINKIISEGAESFEKNHVAVFSTIGEIFKHLRFAGQEIDNEKKKDRCCSLNECINACKDASDNWGSSDKIKKFRLLTTVYNYIKLAYNYVAHSKFKEEIKKIIDKLNLLSQAFK